MSVILRFLAVDEATVGRAWRAVLLGGLLAAAFAVAVSFRDAWIYGGIDLRPKVVGARALLAGLDPYRFQWTPGTSDELLDPWIRPGEPSRINYPPTALLFYSSFAWLPYRPQRLLWSALEWVALFASIVLLSRTIPGTRGRLAFSALALYAFAAADFWRFHVERGQFYVFVVFFLAFGAFRTLSRAADSWSAGVAFGIAAALRPTFAVMLLPLWVLRMRRTCVAGIATGCLAILATLPMGGLRAWTGYSENVRGWEQLFASGYWTPGHPPPPPTVPQIAEGVAPNGMAFDFTNLTLVGLYNRYHLRDRLAGVGLPYQSPVVSKVLAALWLTVAALIAWIARRRPPSARGALSIAVVTAMGLEFLLPLRLDYAEVLHMVPLALVTPALVEEARGPYLLALALCAFAAGMNHEFGVGFRSVLLMGVCTLAASSWALGRGGGPPERA